MSFITTTLTKKPLKLSHMIERDFRQTCPTFAIQQWTKLCMSSEDGEIDLDKIASVVSKSFMQCLDQYFQIVWSSTPRGIRCCWLLQGHVSQRLKAGGTYHHMAQAPHQLLPCGSTAECEGEVG